MATSENSKTASRSRTRDFGVGLPARRAAVGLVRAVLSDGQPLDEALIRSKAARRMDSMAVRDRALARAIASTTLRRLGQIEATLNAFLDKGMPKKAGSLREVLLTGASQILFLDTPNHAAIDLAVTLAKQDRRASHFSRLVNAVLRKVADKRPEVLASQDEAQLNTPGWLWTRWVSAYGEETARRIASAHLQEAAIDLTVKTEPKAWADQLEGLALPTGSVRLKARGRIEALDGYDSGDWWVQDAAAALPARLFGDLKGKRVVDLCAAPGGKTAQLIMAGAEVTAVDSSPQRLERLRENLDRLKLQAAVVCEDAGAWQPGTQFDAVLLDAPCTGTGTLRRHPDIAWLKSASDLEELTRIQQRLLRHAVSLVAPGGMLVYCTCSLEPEEGESQVAMLLEDHPDLALEPVTVDEIGGEPGWINASGQLRTLPFDLRPGPDIAPGLDGFFAAKLTRKP